MQKILLKAFDVKIKQLSILFIVFSTFYFNSAYSKTKTLFHTNNWQKIDAFHKATLEKKQEIMQGLFNERKNCLPKKAVLHNEIDTLQAYIGRFGESDIDELAVTNKSRIAITKDSSLIITKCYARILEHSSAESIKHAILDTLASLELSRFIPIEQVRIIASINSRWKQYLFTIIGHNIVKLYLSHQISFTDGTLPL